METYPLLAFLPCLLSLSPFPEADKCHRAAAALCPPDLEFSVPSNKTARAGFTSWGFGTAALWFLLFVLWVRGLGGGGSCRFKDALKQGDAV